MILCGFVVIWDTWTGQRGENRLTKTYVNEKWKNKNKKYPKRIKVQQGVVFRMIK